MLPLIAALALNAASAGSNLQVAQVHTLLTNTPRSCIAVRSKRGDVRIVLDKDDLIKIENGSLIHGTSDQRRMGMIRSERAKQLLVDTSNQKDDLGCYVNSVLSSNKRAVTDWVYLVFYIFKQGHGRVWSVGDKAYLASYQYVTYGAHCGWCPAGFEALKTSKGSSFLFAQLYVR